MRHGDMVKADKITDKMPLTKAAQSSRRQRKLSTAATATPGKRAAPPDIGHNAASGEAASAKKLQKEGAARMRGGDDDNGGGEASGGRGCLRVRAITCGRAWCVAVGEVRYRELCGIGKEAAKKALHGCGGRRREARAAVDGGGEAARGRAVTEEATSAQRLRARRHATWALS